MSHGESYPVVEAERPIEVVPQHEVTLLDFYSDRVVTFKGITAPLGALFQLCPVPHEQMTSESKNNYAANILDGAGIDYKTEMAELKAMAEQQEPAAVQESKKKVL